MKPAQTSIHLTSQKQSLSLRHRGIAAPDIHVWSEIYTLLRINLVKSKGFLSYFIKVYPLQTFIKPLADGHHAVRFALCISELNLQDYRTRLLPERHLQQYACSRLAFHVVNNSAPAQNNLRHDQLNRRLFHPENEQKCLFCISLCSILKSY